MSSAKSTEQPSVWLNADLSAKQHKELEHYCQDDHRYATYDDNEYDDNGYNIADLLAQGWKAYDGPPHGITRKLLYKYFVDDSLAMTYPEAKLFCENKNSTLAAITNQDEYDFVHSEKLFSDDVVYPSDSGVWLGGYFNGSDYVWLENENLEQDKLINFDYFTSWRQDFVDSLDENPKHYFYSRCISQILCADESLSYLRHFIG